MNLLITCTLFASLAQTSPAKPSGITGPMPLAWRWVQTTKVSPAGMPLVHERRVYLAVGQRVYALDADTGNELWKYPTIEIVEGNFRVSPVKVGNTLVVPTDTGVLYGLDSATGKLKWQYALANLGPDLRFIGQPAALNTLAVLALSDNTLLAFDPETGKPAWEKSLPIANGVMGELTAYGDSVLALTNGNELVSVNGLTQKINWTAKFTSITPNTKPVVFGDTLYLVSSTYLVAINGVTGRGRWQLDIGEPVSFGPAVSSKGILVVTRDGKGLLLNANGRRATKEPLDIGSGPVALPTAAGEMYVVPTANGAINLIEPATNKIVWSFVVRPLTLPISGDLRIIESELVDPRQLTVQAAGPVVVADNTLLVLAKDGSLLAFDPNLGVDLTPPDVFMIWPPAGSQMSGRPPLEFVFKIADEATGVKVDTLKIDIEGQPMEYQVTRDGVASVRISHSGANKPLTDGRKSITVRVEDWIGNVQTKTYNVSIDNQLPPLGRPGAAPPSNRPGERPGGRAGGGVGGG